MNMKQWIKKTLLFGCTLAMIGGMLMLVAVNAAALSLSDFGVEKNRPSSASDNVIKNGGFESTDNAQWNTDSFLNSSLCVVEDSTAPEGNNVLCYKNTSNQETWHTFTVSVSKNTDYVFSVWVKTPYLSATNKAKATIGVIDPSTGKFAIFNDSEYKNHVSSDKEQIRSTATDGEWHLRSVQFTTDSTSITIAVYGYMSEMYFDDMALFKCKGFLGLIASGKAYQGPRLTTTLTASSSVANKYCKNEDSLIPDPYLTTPAADNFWTKESGGWKNGFMSFVDSGDTEHGRVMRYSASANPIKLNYFKWLKVEPNTSYTISFDYKVTKAGTGKIKITDNNIELPKEIVSISLSNTSNWQSFSRTIDSKVFTQFGFVIQDAGGEVLIDNIRLFKTADGIAEEPEEVRVPVLKPESGLTSTMEMGEEGLGVSFLMQLQATGVALNEKQELVLEDALVDAFGDGRLYRLLRMGAVMTNSPAIGKDAGSFTLEAESENSGTVVNIPAVYGLAPDAELGIAPGEAAYAVRIVRIPTAHRYTRIYARPYYVFEYAGEEIVVYGDICSRSYEE